MNQDQIINTLAQLTGQLQAKSREEERLLEEVMETLATSLLQQDPATLSNRQLDHQESDLFFKEHIDESRLEKIREIAIKVVATKPADDFRVFVRDTPVRTTQVKGSVPLFAAGANLFSTIGPFRSLPDGRDVNFDVFRIVKLIALYQQGQALPALLFKASISKIVIPAISARYTLVPDTIYIKSSLLGAAAPADFYCGLRIKSGTISLNIAPQTINNQLVFANTTRVQVQLVLDQPLIAAPADAGPFGIDARNMTIQLPDLFEFEFTGNARAYTKIGAGNWNVYGNQNQFSWGGSQAGQYNPALNRVAIPVNFSNAAFDVTRCESPFCTWSGKSTIFGAGWFLNAGSIDINNPLQAAGNGAYAVLTQKGLECSWQGLQGGTIDIGTPFIMAEPGRISVTDLVADASGCFQQYQLWADEYNKFGSQVKLNYKKQAGIVWNSLAKGDEVMLVSADTGCQADRPVKTNGEPVQLRGKNCVVSIAVSKFKRLLSIADANLDADNPIPVQVADPAVPVTGSPLKKLLKGRVHAMALHNALLTTTPPKSYLLFAELDADLVSLGRGQLIIQFGLYSYLPTLPDPYAANLGVLKSQYKDLVLTDRLKAKVPTREWLTLTAKVMWEQRTGEMDKVGVSFHFAPKTEDLEKLKNTNLLPFEALLGVQQIPGTFSVARTNPLFTLAANAYALLDVSSRANQVGVSFGLYGGRQQFVGARMMNIQQQDTGLAAAFPLQVRGMDMVTYGFYARAFTMPQIAWEPVMNTTQPAVAKDPPFGWNFYQNDGIPGIIGNQSRELVSLAPLPLVKFLEQQYHEKKDVATFALFNLPFGMVAAAILKEWKAQGSKADIHNLRPDFGDYIHGGIQLELTAGSSLYNGEDNLFQGICFQLENINDILGQPSNTGTLGSTVNDIFNKEFKTNESGDPGRTAVPLERIGLSGYGASMFSNWLNKDAAIAEVSQALFNATVGRTGHEVIQVKSILYPWGIRVVRTITLYRLNTGYVMRVDSGWRAESSGTYDFSYQTRLTTGVKIPHANPYDIHPGIIRGLYNITNIRENGIDYQLNTIIKTGDLFIEANMANPNFGNLTPNAGAPFAYPSDLRGLTFDADVMIENLEQGGSGNLVASKGIRGWVQVAPKGVPIPARSLAELLAKQNGSIGGEINAIVKLGGTAQRMRLMQFDFNLSVNDAGTLPVFAAAGRGALSLPKDGSWSAVSHNRGTGDITQLPTGTSIPVIRIALRDKGYGSELPAVDALVNKNLLRIANPLDLLRPPTADTVNFGMLQNVDTQKILFLTPAFVGTQKFLLSKTPPLLSDTYRLLNTKGIFPNVGDAENTFGIAIQLLKGIDGNHNPLQAFNPSGIADGAKQAFQLLEIKAKEEAGKLLEQGYKLVKNAANAAIDKVFKFDLPAFEYPLVDITGLKIFIEYKASSKNRPPAFSDPKFDAGKLDFDIDTFGDQAKQVATDLKETWKGRMNNVAMVVNLGPIERLMTIKGNFNSSKGKPTDFGSKSSDDSGFALPTPEIEFKQPELQTIIQVLEILAALSTGKYADAVKNGLKIAMSNSANLWEYKFEATKDIPVLRFPPMPEYNNAQCPFKLEAGLTLGVYFNAALKVTSDPKQLLPTAGAFFRFHAGMQVMVVSLAAASVFAVGQVDLEVAADTSPVISLRMKFGFGANLVVGLPVVGNVSIMFLVGVEIYVDSTQKMIITAFLLFKGQAELLGGLISVTITIEAKGSVERQAGADQPCNCMAQVTFGLDISIFLVINISFSESWQETRQIS